MMSDQKEPTLEAKTRMQVSIQRQCLEGSERREFEEWYKNTLVGDLMVSWFARREPSRWGRGYPYEYGAKHPYTPRVVYNRLKQDGFLVEYDNSSYKRDVVYVRLRERDDE